MQLDGALTYERIVETGIRRAVNVLAFYGDTAAAEPLFAADPALADDAEALSHAATRGHEAFVRLLLRYQPDLATKVTVARPREMAKFLFEHGMDPNRPNWLRITPLHTFAGHGQVEEAALFLDHGADLHARDEEWSSTPLAWAARAGQTRMVEFLLRRGARPSLPDDPAVGDAEGVGGEARTRRDRATAGGVERSGLPPRRLDQYDALARDLMDAYGGDPAALQRIIEYFRAERVFRGTGHRRTCGCRVCGRACWSGWAIAEAPGRPRRRSHLMMRAG